MSYRFGGKARPGSQVQTWLPRGSFNPGFLSPSLWLDASDTTTITASSGAVSQINDKSGNGRHFSQGTAASQPETGTRTVNGLNSLDIVLGDFMTYDAGSDAVDMSPLSLFVVVVYDAATAGGGAMFSARRSASGAYDYQSPNLLSFRNNSANLSSYVSGTLLTNPGIAYSNDVSLIYEVRADGTTSYHRVNGGIEYFASSSAPANMRYLRIGAGISDTTTNIYSNGRFDGAFCECVMFNENLSDADRLSVRRYLADKWAVTI